MEIALLHAAVLEGDFTAEGQAQAHDGAALHLRADAFGVDLRTAVQGHVHGHDAHLALGIHRHFHHAGRVADEAVAERSEERRVGSESECRNVQRGLERYRWYATA